MIKMMMIANSQPAEAHAGVVSHSSEPGKEMLAGMIRNAAWDASRRESRSSKTPNCRHTTTRSSGSDDVGSPPQAACLAASRSGAELARLRLPGRNPGAGTTASDDSLPTSRK